jgi:hypothetical protein
MILFFMHKIVKKKIFFLDMRRIFSPIFKKVNIGIYIGFLLPMDDTWILFSIHPTATIRFHQPGITDRITGMTKADYSLIFTLIIFPSI